MNETYKIIKPNGEYLNNPKYSIQCTTFEKNQIQKIKNLEKYKGCIVKNDSTGQLKPIEKF